jgi:co-chaperonin GroES (HSP10)
MKIRPLSQYTIIKLDPSEKQIGSILTPGGTFEQFNVPKRTGTVMAVGRGLVTAGGQVLPPQVVPGDRVYVLEAKVKIEVEYDGVMCLALSDESHIVGVIVEDNDGKEG